MTILVGMIEPGDTFMVHDTHWTSTNNLIYEVVHVIHHSQVTTGRTPLVEVCWSIWDPWVGAEHCESYWTRYPSPQTTLHNFVPLSTQGDIPL